MARRSVLVSTVAAALLIAAELVARFGLGLGDPPLYVEHPSVEYLLAPDQSCSPYGNRFIVNAFGMRSVSFPRSKSSPEELRVMVFGDSVVNGGSLTDHDDLATTRAELELRIRLARPVVVGNVSAGSWGPANWLGYTRDLGLFEAELALVVVSSRDAHDVASFRPLDPSTHPTRKPPLALLDGARLVRRLLTRGRHASRGSATRRDATPQLAETLDLLAADTRVAVLLHPSLRELESGRLEPGAAQLRAVVESRELPFVELANYYRGADPGALYRDGIHPTSAGQLVLAQAIVETVELLRSGQSLSR